jgi:hypothetical protein
VGFLKTEQHVQTGNNNESEGFGLNRKMSEVILPKVPISTLQRPTFGPEGYVPRIPFVEDELKHNLQQSFARPAYSV